MKLSDRILPAIFIGLVVVVGAIASHSCANTTTPPTGGPKDTIPPEIVKVSPLSGTLHTPTHKTKLKFTFNEYVVVKDGKSIFLSPPSEKSPKYKISDKSVIVYFENDLDSNRTYILDLTNAIGDNNEGNMFPGYTLVFSTGDHIDSMVVTGTVRDCNTLNPIKGATVMLYKDHADSALFLHRPDAACKTDAWGFFAIRNLQDTVYRRYAMMDANTDTMYQPENEKVAFVDTLIKPTMVAVDSLFELGKYDMKDTLNCLARKSEVDLALFREKPTKQMIVNKERIGERTAYITFMAPNAEIDSIWIKGISPSRLITQFNLQKDSLEIWVNDARKQPDTLFLNVDYMKTDSLGALVKTHEVVKLSKPRELASAAKKSTKIKKEDTLCVFTMTATPDMVEQYGFQMEFKYPIVENGFDSLVFSYINPKQQEISARYTVEQDSLNLRKYTVWPSEKLLPGYEYKLKIPHRKFKDINGFYNDSLETKVSLPNDDKLSTLLINMNNVGGRKYIVDLLGEKKDKVIRQFIIDSDRTLTFPYLKAGQLYIRLTEDLHPHGLVDTANVLEKRQPEKVKFYKLEDGTEMIDIIEMTEIEQTLDVGELFK
ncbi:MAG: Ig-like domain-containing protein [Bacteroidales bacterium]|nr:Ig-like domain-containing protein [Bacteroidales bacterium]